jgi:hypothetical protein
MLSNRVRNALLRMPVWTVRCNGKGHAGGLDKQLFKSLEHGLIGVGSPFSLVQDLEPRVHEKGLDETASFVDRFVDAPGVCAVALARLSQTIQACLKLRAIFALDAISYYDKNRALIVLNASRRRWCPPMQRRREIQGRPGLQFPAPTQRYANQKARRGCEYACCKP